MNVTLRRASLALAILAGLAAVAAVLVARSNAIQPLGPQTTVVKGEPTAADPVDSTRWLLRTIPRQTLLCLSARHVGSRQNVGSCKPKGRSWATVRLIEGRVPRTFVFGYAAPGVRRVTVSGPGGARIFELTRSGRTFLAVFAGRVMERDLAAVATDGAGGHKAIGFDAQATAAAADPHHGPAWFASVFKFRAGPRRGQTCVSVGQEPPRFGPAGPRGVSHPICSDLTGTEYFFAVVRMRGQTVLTGVAKKSVRRIAARPYEAAISTRPLTAAIDHRTGAFVLVFDGTKVRSDRLAITVRTKRRTAVFAGQRAMNMGFLVHIPNDLLRNAQSGRGDWLYHGLRITNDAAARHHLKCLSDLRICDDSMEKLLAYALHQGTAGGRYEVPDGNVCPLIPFDPLPPGAGNAAAAEVLRELPALYGDAQTAGAKVVAVAPATRAGPRGAYARVKCGKTAQRRSLVVLLRFPAMLPSASMSQGAVLVGRFWGRMRVWALLH